MSVIEDFNRHAILVALKAGRSAEEIAEFLGFTLAAVNTTIHDIMPVIGGKPNEVYVNNLPQ